jgi:hypothetical protein
VTTTMEMPEANPKIKTGTLCVWPNYGSSPKDDCGYWVGSVESLSSDGQVVATSAEALFLRKLRQWAPRWGLDGLHTGKEPTDPNWCLNWWLPRGRRSARGPATPASGTPASGEPADVDDGMHIDDKKRINVVHSF